ncbi:MAG: Smr/MutS family protein [Metamycoplasmataceae bacterium]
MKLDLHGFSVEEATAQITMAFFSFKNNEYETELTIITGKGTGAMQTTFLNLIEEEATDFYCEEINGGGAYIVKKHHST